MRMFIAIELPEEIRKHLSGLQQELTACQADVKWVEPDNIHLTLKFLGEIDEKTKDAVIGALDDIAGRHKAFACSLGAAGAFPRIESPRVIWQGLTQGDSEVKQIAVSLEQSLAAIGIPQEDRPFSSHITLGRTRSAKNIRRLSEMLHSLAGQPKDSALTFKTEKITLFKSTLSPRGPTYEVIHEARL